jgi:restriction endonuclease S subunit
VLRATPEIDPQFLYQITMLREFRRDGEMAMTGAAGQQRIPLDFVREFLFGYPPMEEQRRLLDFVNKKSNKVRQAVEKTNREIVLIGEYRERLISDVVTGKLNVRSVDFAAVEDDMMIDDTEDLDRDIEPDNGDVMEEADAED